MITSPPPPCGSGRSYIGQTTQPIEERFKQHQKPSSDCVLISNAIQKYGWENMAKEWYEVPDEYLNEHEELMVEVLGTLAPDGYNLRKGGECSKMSDIVREKMSKSHKGKTIPEEVKQKISQAQIGDKNSFYGMFHTPEAKQKMSESHLGMTHTLEARQRMSESQTGEKNPMYGKTHTLEARQRMSETRKGRTHPEEVKQKMSESKKGANHHASKRVYQYEPDGTYIDDFGSSGEAARSLGKNTTAGILRCTNGKQKTAYGFFWSYEKL